MSWAVGGSPLHPLTGLFTFLYLASPDFHPLVPRPQSTAEQFRAPRASSQAKLLSMDAEDSNQARDLGAAPVHRGTGCHKTPSCYREKAHGGRGPWFGAQAPHLLVGELGYLSKMATKHGTQSLCQTPRQDSSTHHPRYTV
jgi:hypothetical protein